jgi:eukaryotic-like serine/threonine-protein kinase
MDRESDPLEATLDAQLDTLGPMAATMQENPSSTIEPVQHRRVDTGGQRALEALDGLRRSVPPAAPAALRLERTLGEGGMGIVRLGEQTSLGRKVAVKTLRDGVTDEGAKLRLLREAWITGALEHPNVVPVHDVSLDAKGQPVIVLKRIEGVEWCELMGDAERVRERFGANDLLEWNLQILMQVCNAVHFAHNQGILHRDLKPENVMVGSFGEVYVLDWGIAVSIRDDGSGRFPLASQATEMAGTPCYMAPEMLGGSAPNLSPRTDVYLLGAILYEILSGSPPHDGASPAALVRSVLASSPPMPDGVPEELAAICRRAMAVDPAERFESAEAFRLALVEFVRHRGSSHLAEAARRRLVELREGVKDARSLAPREVEDHALHLYDLFGECRFGFQQAVRDWPDNRAARRGLHLAFEAMVRFELAHGDPRAASRLLAEMDEAPADLSEQVQRARASADKRQKELEDLSRALDPSTGRRTRTAVAGFLGILWTLAPLAVAIFAPDKPDEPLHLKAAAVGYLVIALGLGLWARESMMKTLINRRIYASLIFVLVTTIVLASAAPVMGLEPATLRTLSPFLWCVLSGMMAIHLDPRFAVISFGFLVAFGAAMRWPEAYYFIVAAANFNMAVLVVIFFWNMPREVIHASPFERFRR